jgi:hypothetical protein
MPQPVPDPALADPFFRPLRLAHPDVDIVLLPPPVPVDRGVPVASPGQVRALQRHATAVLDALASRVGREASDVRGYWWTQAHPEVHRWVLTASFTGLDPGGGVALLRHIGDALLELGWEARPAADGRPRLRAVAGPVELVASAYDDAVSVTITTDAVHAPADVLEVAQP